MLKIFGFTDKEIRGMYIRANTIVVILLILITLPFQTMLMVSIWPACISTIPGFLNFVMQPEDILYYHRDWYYLLYGIESVFHV